MLVIPPLIRRTYSPYGTNRACTLGADQMDLVFFQEVLLGLLDYYKYCEEDSAGRYGVSFSEVTVDQINQVLPN